MLWLNETPVDTIAPLAKAPLVSLTLHRTRVTDLSPLAGTVLQRLHIAETPIADLAPLRGLPLTRLIFSPTTVTNGLEVVRAMTSLTELGSTLEARMPPENFWILLEKGTIK